MGVTQSYGSELQHTKPLDGIRVVDFTHAGAGACCTQLLQAVGADVIKIERPGPGDDLRHHRRRQDPEGASMSFVVLNAGKRSLVLNLKADESRAIVERLVAGGDVVVENFRPGVADSLGIGWDDVRRMNERIVYCSLTGFGLTGELRNLPAYDGIIQAMSGIMFVNGDADSEPLRVGLPLVDLFAGNAAAFAVLAALARRERVTGAQRIDVSMLDSLLTLLGRQVADYLYNGSEPERTGNRGVVVPTSATYRTSDGYLTIAANQQPQWEALCQVLGEHRLLEDERFSSHGARALHREELASDLAEILSTRSGAHLERELAAAKVPASKVRTLPELLTESHVSSRGSLSEINVPGTEKPAQTVALGFALSDAGNGPVDLLGQRSVPTVGQHTDEILRELGFTESEIDQFQSQGAV